MSDEAKVIIALVCMLALFGVAESVEDILKYQACVQKHSHKDCK